MLPEPLSSPQSLYVPGSQYFAVFVHSLSLLLVRKPASVLFTTSLNIPARLDNGLTRTATRLDFCDLSQDIKVLHSISWSCLELKAKQPMLWMVWPAHCSFYHSLDHSFPVPSLSTSWAKHDADKGRSSSFCVLYGPSLFLTVERFFVVCLSILVYILDPSCIVCFASFLMQYAAQYTSSIDLTGIALVNFDTLIKTGE